MPWRQALSYLTSPDRINTTLAWIAAVLVVVGSCFHSYWVCTNLVAEREQHRDWLQNTYAELSKVTNDEIAAARMAIDRSTEFNKEMRRELDLRENRMALSTDKIEALAVALDWQAREFRKAALTFINSIEKGKHNAGTE